MAQEFVFAPLGGIGEIGMNLSIYGFGDERRRQWLIVDCGVTFGDDSQPGLEVVMPDPGFIVERRDRLLGIVATHAHEDHIGAIPYLWTQLRCPVWATPFTASLLHAKLLEAGIADKVRINVVPMSGRFSVGPFDLELITLTHSIPEPNAVALRTPVGTVLHTGDWKFDPDPLIGSTADEAALRRPMGGRDVLAAQIERLMDAVSEPNITLQVMPFRYGGHAAEGGAFTIMRFPETDLPDVVYMEYLTGAHYIDKPEEVERYAAVMERLSVAGTSPDRTREILTGMLKDI